MHNTSVYILLFLLLTFSSSLNAHPSQEEDTRVCAPFRGGVVDPAIVSSMLQAKKEGVLYRIQTNKSEVGFCVDSGVGRVEAQFKDIKGGLALRRKIWGDESQMLVMVDANSISMDESFIRNMMTSEFFLNTYMYPKILFVSTGIHWLDHEKAILRGNLTLHGVTRPVRFEITMNMIKSRPSRHQATNAIQKNVGDIIVIAKSFINRSDFNMNKLEFMVSDEIELCMRIEASLFK
jgi:polyisoprenoid-binding protein YceI